jgi:hypothetical protein
MVVSVQSETEFDRRGNVQYKLRNGSEVGAVVLKSWWMWCFRRSNHGLNTNMDELLNDPMCQYGESIGRTSLIDGKSDFAASQGFTVQKDRQFLQMFVRVEYARSDRLRIGEAQTFHLQAIL